MTPTLGEGSGMERHDQGASPLADAILSEIAELLERLVATGETGAIDLRGLPMTEVDTRRLEDMLGSGEVRAELQVVGQSEVWETAYAGVWWVRHRGADARITAEEIVVTRVPVILMTHEDDARAASERLRQEIARRDEAGRHEETAHV